MVLAPLWPEFFERAKGWLVSELGAEVRAPVRPMDGRNSWAAELSSPSVRLLGTQPQLLLPFDFPLSLPRVRYPESLRLRLPHVEVDGRVCLDVDADPSDLHEPSSALRRTLESLTRFVARCSEPGWVAAEFHRERMGYWAIHAATAKAPESLRTKSIVLDVPWSARSPFEAAALPLDDKRALVTAPSAPDDIARRHGLRAGQLVHAKALVVTLDPDVAWTPRTWPKTVEDLDAMSHSFELKPGAIESWLERQRVRPVVPVFVVVKQGSTSVGWRVIRPLAGTAALQLVPVTVNRVDRQWALCRDQDVDRLALRTAKHVALVGCGAVGSPLAHLLARAGVGHITLVDGQDFEAENVSRHVLGLDARGINKAAALAQRLEREVPGLAVAPIAGQASVWMRAATRRYDLVIDCTAERSVRMLLSNRRTTHLHGAPVLMAWLEPGAAAGHVVLVGPDQHWPSNDPADESVNIGKWPPGLQVELPGCGHGFHPYGMQETFAIAALACERALRWLDGDSTAAGVWSWSKTSNEFNLVAPDVELRVQPRAAPGQLTGAGPGDHSLLEPVNG